MEKGKTIFLDIFRRADKNDDGAISWEEFVQFFADGVMGKEEMEKLFHDIDTHNTNNIDTGELCEYFISHLGEMKEIYSLIEDLNSKVTSVLQSAAQSYPEKNRTDKFITRFLMRECVNQLTAVQRPLESASDHMDEEARDQNAGIKPIEPRDVLPKPDVIPGRVGRRTKRQISSQTSTPTDGNPVALTAQVDRLAELLDRLEHGVNFKGFIDEDLNAVEEDQYVIQQRSMEVVKGKEEEFRTTMRQYVEDTNNSTGALNVSVRFFKDSGLFTLYEVWESAELEEQYRGKKAFDSVFTDALVSGVTLSSITFPKAWWLKN
ncbi:N-terminal EF-hand calcium-binding protein 1-like [Crassostrea virginica]|uniref:N-terminal EF-hand calcium-binding protein 1-like n=1 Tax=Crassostrea virginica TaxID=6565 RepID=A0A8B8EFQ5_CRAVI|nr:N-terminal EF-hand calcium-binding protein 1-like [Crassostrea virginica]